VLLVRAGDGLTVSAGTSFSIATMGDEPFEAVACIPSGSRARIAGGEPFLPPWAI
jgi:mannose-6-phosphate isomerase-like protein (cupin superfamily)